MNRRAVSRLAAKVTHVLTKYTCNKEEVSTFLAKYSGAKVVSELHSIDKRAGHHLMKQATWYEERGAGLPSGNSAGNTS